MISDQIFIILYLSHYIQHEFLLCGTISIDSIIICLYHASLIMFLLATVLFDVDIANSLIRRDYSVHAGKNLTLPCLKNENTVLWTRDGVNLSSLNVSTEHKLFIALIIKENFFDRKKLRTRTL
jgi:hypothetical protein